MTDWIAAAETLRQAKIPAVLVTVAGVRGSAPRETGARMLVTADEIHGTIGGGQLEYRCAGIASGLLAAAGGASAGTGFLRRFPLGTNCGQCCGGVVDVLFEDLRSASWLGPLAEHWHARRSATLLTTIDDDGCPRTSLVERSDAVWSGLDGPMSERARAALTQAAHGRAVRVDTPGRGQRFVLLVPVMDSGFDIAVFGAGHVGSAVVQVLSGLDCSLRWVDSRRNIFPPAVPGGVRCIETAEPEREVAALPRGSYCLVMTHSHALDLAIVAAILRRGDSAYCGLIGSATKRRRFAARLRQQGLSAAQLDRLVCPIGIAGIKGKRPQEIAISAAAEILRRRERLQASANERAGAVHRLHA